MKVIVPVKRVVDCNARVRIAENGTGVDLANIKMSMNPFDEIAVEAAVRLKEQGQASEIVAVSIGPREAAETLRIALAIGATRAILVVADGAIEPLAAAKILKCICDSERPALVIAGKQAIDDDCGQTGPMLAALLGWGQAARAYRLEVDGTSARVTCESDRGLHTVAVRLPAVVTTDLRLNEPRYASLSNLMKARKMPVEEKTLADFAVDAAPRLTVLGLAEPKPRAKGVMAASVGDLVDRLIAARAI